MLGDDHDHAHDGEDGSTESDDTTPCRPSWEPGLMTAEALASFARGLECSDRIPMLTLAEEEEEAAKVGDALGACRADIMETRPSVE